ncbi:MAG: CRISPR system precrRNA processing endoribonuclease RAMP protein Cas6 [Zavarzinella sp.]
MLSILQTTRNVRLTTPGRLLPWMGMAIRGLVGARLKATTCLCGPPDELGKITHQTGCAYGETIDATPTPANRNFAGQDDGFRPVVIAPQFPCKVALKPGDGFRVTVSFFGSTAIAWHDLFWETFAHCGQDSAAGFNPFHTQFTLEPILTRKSVDINPVRPLKNKDSAVDLEIELTSPLFLREEYQRGKHRTIFEPTFADFMGASLRTLGGLFRCYDKPLQADFARMKELAASVLTESHSFRPFKQLRHSNRTDHRAVLQGVIGKAQFRQVPVELIPWIHYAGIVHVGPHRVAGAGGWKTTLMQ